MNNLTPVVQSTTEHLTIAELLGSHPIHDQLPQGWAHPKAIAQIAIGSKALIKNLRTRAWELGEILEYWEMGQYLTAICGKRKQLIFTIEHIAIKSNGG